MKKILIPLTILSLLPLYAQNKDNPSFLDTILDNTEDHRKTIHQSLISLSSNIDGYFIPQEIKDVDYSSTYGQIEFSSYINEGDSISFDQKIRIKLILPKLKEKFRLEIETSDERETIDTVEDHDKKTNDNLSVGLAYYKVLKNKINLKSKTGLKVRSKFDPFFEIEANKTWNENTDLEYILSQKFKQSVVKHTESTTFFRIDKMLDDTYSLHNYYQQYWQSKQENDSEYYASIYLNQKLTDSRNLTYTVDSNINNIDSDMKAKRYSLKVKYKHYLKKWLYFDVTPENYYKEDENFKGKFALKLNLGMYFNKDSYRK